MPKISNKQKFILGFIGIFVSLCVSELIIRKLNIAPRIIDYTAEGHSPFRLVSNPKIIYEYVPQIHPDINKQGFRDANFIKEKGKNTIRIAMLGDSITEGSDVPLGKTFSDVLENLLNKKASLTESSLRYEVMNFGVGGYNLGAETEILKTKVIQYSPDIVIFNIFLDDIMPLPGIEVWLAGNSLTTKEKFVLLKKYHANRNSLMSSFRKRVLHKSKLFLFLEFKLKNIWQSQLYELVEREEARGNKTIRIIEEENTFIQTNFKEIKRLKQTYGFKFLICFHPHLLYSEDLISEKLFRKVAEEFDFPFFRMYDYYKSRVSDPDSLQPKPNDYCHPNELGHQIAGEAIFRELQKRNFINLSQK